MKRTGRIITVGLLVIITCLAVLGWVMLPREAAEEGQEPWSGVDVGVIEKYAVDAGRTPREPFINTDQGDLLLFVFALAGAVGGFIAGYSWRRLIVEKGNGRKDE